MCFTLCVLYDSLHQGWIFCDALSHQQETLRDSQPFHQGQLTYFLLKKVVKKSLLQPVSSQQHF